MSADIDIDVPNLIDITLIEEAYVNAKLEWDYFK